MEPKINPEKMMFFRIPVLDALAKKSPFPDSCREIATTEIGAALEKKYPTKKPDPPRTGGGGSSSGSDYYLESSTLISGISAAITNIDSSGLGF